MGPVASNAGIALIAFKIGRELKKEEGEFGWDSLWERQTRACVGRVREMETFLTFNF